MRLLLVMAGFSVEEGNAFSVWTNQCATLLLMNLAVIMSVLCPGATMRGTYARMTATVKAD